MVSYFFFYGKVWTSVSIRERKKNGYENDDVMMISHSFWLGKNEKSTMFMPFFCFSSRTCETANKFGPQKIREKKNPLSCPVIVPQFSLSLCLILSSSFMHATDLYNSTGFSLRFYLALNLISLSLALSQFPTFSLALLIRRTKNQRNEIFLLLQMMTRLLLLLYRKSHFLFISSHGSNGAACSTNA